MWEWMGNGAITLLCGMGLVRGLAAITRRRRKREEANEALFFWRYGPVQCLGETQPQPGAKED